MAARLPPLNALRAFEATARHLSFTRAAEEFCVTHGAVSRQVAILEESLGVRLFVRGPRKLELTDAARVYLISVQSAFDMLRTATGQMAFTGRGGLLRIRALHTFVSRWLMPRLQGLDDIKLEISIATTAVSVDFGKSDIHMSIEAGPSKRPGVRSYKLIDMDLTPVCHPSLVNGRPPPTELSELRHYTLLHSVLQPDIANNLWAHWAQGIGFGGFDLSTGSYFQTFDLVYRAAKEGLGIGVGAKCFVQDDLDAGTLIAPFDQIVRFPLPYYLVMPEELVDRPMIARFREWILAEAHSSLSIAA